MEEAIGVRSVERTLAILECFDCQNTQLGITEIASQVGLSKATTHRIVSTLHAHGYLTQNRDNQKYTIGHKVMQLARVFQHSFSFRDVARPYMEEVRRMVDESVSLYVYSSGIRICVDRIESSQPLRRVVSLGEQLPLDKGAAGKILTTFVGTPQEQAALKVEEMETIKARGYAVSESEREEGVVAIAAPIRDYSGKVVAALSISGPAMRFTASAREKITQLTVEITHKISLELGYKS